MSPGQSSSKDTSPNSANSASSSARTGKLNYCEGESIRRTQWNVADHAEALPFYWLAQALLNTLNAAPPNEPGWNSFSGMKYSEMLKSSRTFTRMGEGVATANGVTTPGLGDLSGLFNDAGGLDGLLF
jgi:hypothetical protein